MAKYRVTLTTEASFTTTVEASDEEEAYELAFEEAPYALCHQEVVDIGDWSTYEDNPELVKLGMKSAVLIGDK